MTAVSEQAPKAATGTAARPRDRDGSLPPAQRDPHPVPPNTLMWKYFADHRMTLTGGRAGTTENMHPQLGQAVSDHSTVFTDVAARVQRSMPFIYGSIYGDDPVKAGIQIRNFHKPLKGVVKAASSEYDGTAYHGLDPETFYWAHATFIDMMYAGVDRFVKKLSLAEKEQIFQESRLWWSLYGVESPANEPTTYLEFQKYWDDVVQNELVGDTKVAQFTVGYITKGITRAIERPKQVPEPVWDRVLGPVINRFFSFVGAGGLDPVMRERLDIPWTTGQDRRYRAVCWTIRRLGPVWEALAPVRVRYAKEAVAGFEREGIDPRSIAAHGR